MRLTVDDLSRAAAGCRALAAVYRRDAERQPSPLTRRQFEREAEALAALAERFERAREARVL